MLTRLLWSNCKRPDVSRHLLQNLPKNPFQNTAREFCSQLKNATHQLPKSAAKHKVLLAQKLLIGTSGVCLGLGGRFLLTAKWQVFCAEVESSNRLVGVVQTTLETEEGKFDWWRLWSYLRPHMWELLGAIVSALLVAYFNIRIPNLLGDLINTLARYANTYVKDPLHNSFFKDIRRPAMNLLNLYVLQSGFTFLYIFLLSRIGEQMAAKLRQDLFKQIIIQDIAFFDANRTGELVNRLTADVHDFKACFKQFVSQGLRSVAQLLGGSISLFLISPHMAAIALAAVPTGVVCMSYLGRKLRKLSKNSQAQSERATTVCEEALSNVRTVRASACEYREMELFEIETNKAAVMAQELGYGVAIFQGLTNFCLNGMVLTTLFMGGALMSTESISPGSLMAFLVASQGVQRSLAQGSMLLGTMIRGMTAGTRVFEFLQIEPQIDLKRGYEIPFKHLNGEIRFENVSFAYPTRPDHKVLQDFSLVLRPGQTVALVGASGSGKSTVAALIERFYEPSDGVIKLDGYKLQDISPYWLRSNVLGFIEQQPVLFATSILENIRYGRANASEKDVHEAAKLSQSHEFVSALPAGYSTNVGERGAQLSGGQRQRIAIARALLRDPKVLILDEATSALDATSEAEVQKALDTAVRNRTTLVIAHRLSTIRNADLIVVLDKGRIVESGKHEELMSKRGLYYDLVRQQEKQSKTETLLVAEELQKPFVSENTTLYETRQPAGEEEERIETSAASYEDSSTATVESQTNKIPNETTIRKLPLPEMTTERNYSAQG